MNTQEPFHTVFAVWVENAQDAMVNAGVIRWSLPAAWVLGASLFLVMGFTTRGL